MGLSEQNIDFQDGGDGGDGDELQVICPSFHKKLKFDFQDGRHGGHLGF